VNGRSIEFVERLLCVAQVVTSNRRHLLDDVVRGASRPGGAGPFLLARHQLRVGRQRVVERLQRRLFAREGPLIDEPQLQLGRRTDDVLRATNVTDSGKLHEDLIAGAVAGDDRLGNTELVDAAFDRLESLRDRLIAELVRDVRLYTVGIAARLRRSVVHGFGIRRLRTERGIVGDAISPELGWTGGFEL